MSSFFKKVWRNRRPLAMLVITHKWLCGLAPPQSEVHHSRRMLRLLPFVQPLSFGVVGCLVLVVALMLWLHCSYSVALVTMVCTGLLGVAALMVYDPKGVWSKRQLLDYMRLSKVRRRYYGRAMGALAVYTLYEYHQGIVPTLTFGASYVATVLAVWGLVALGFKPNSSERTPPPQA